MGLRCGRRGGLCVLDDDAASAKRRLKAVDALSEARDLLLQILICALAGTLLWAVWRRGVHR